MIKAVIFDLDGVLVSTDELHYKAWKHVADQEHIRFDQIINNRIRGVLRMDSLDIILAHSDKTFDAFDKVRLADQKNRYFLDLLTTFDASNIMPGVVETLKFLKSNNIPIAIGSSSANSKTILNQIGLLDEFDVIVDGNNFTRSKPDPEVFLLASSKLGIPPEYCLVVEDGISGVKAALAAGMSVFALGDAAKSNLASYQGESIHQIIALF